MSSKGKKRRHEESSDEESEESEKAPSVNPIKIANTVAKPKVGIRVDVRDQDNLWSPGRVVEIARDKSGVSAIVRFNGWGPDYDERFPWNSDRLVPEFAFTKQVKCLVELIPKPRGKPTRAQLETLSPGAKRSFSTLWPCKVQFRMPHPFESDASEDDLFYAKDFLKTDERVFIQPYAPQLLPKVTFDGIDGGHWLNAKKVRHWTEDTQQLGILPKNFQEAFEIAQEDDTIVGTLPASAFEQGSLLKAVYRVYSLEGAEVRDGALREASEIPKHWLDESLQPDMVDPSELEKQQNPSTGEEEAKVETNEAEVEMEEAATNEAQANTPFVPPPPPSLPPAIPITDSVYEGCGVRRSKNQWAASVCLGGNELFLGTFPTQTQAYQATRIAVDEGTEIETNIAQARLEDLRSVPIEAVIEAREKKYDANIHEFSLHEYALQQIRYDAGLLRLGLLKNVPPVQQQKEASPPRTKKRKGTPRKVDLHNHCYID